MFTSIKEWENEYFRKLNSKSQESYLDEMQKKVVKLQQDFEKIPFSASFHNKLWRYNSDIEQLQWRIEYCKKIHPNTKSEGQ